MINKIQKMIKMFFLLGLFMGNIVNAWEVNTHRLIDRRASKIATNLEQFMNDAKLTRTESFEDDLYIGYGTTYFKYITANKKIDGVVHNSAMSEIELKFGKDDYNYKELIEAGSILEDATWSGWDWSGGYGRFLNHFLNPQFGDDGFLGYGNAWYWATQHSDNKYGYALAREYFTKSFTESSTGERQYNRAKMFVSIGHLMHLFNDMNVPAHTRGDPHNPDPLELWMRGGKHYKGSTGFYISGSSPAGELKTLNTEPNKFVDFKTSFMSEAERTSKEFLSEDVMFGDLPLPSLDGVETKKIGHGNFMYAVNGDKIMSRAQKSLLWGGEYVYFVDDSVVSNPVHRSYGEILIPRAIANAAGFVNYFFRGSIDVQILEAGISVKNNSNEELVADTSVVTFHDGEFQIYWDDEDGVRHTLLDEAHKLDNDLAPDDEEIIDELSDEQKEKLLNHNITVVYTGFIGTEQSVAVYSMKNFVIKKEDWAKLGSDENSTYITGLEAYSMPSNKINIVSERVDDDLPNRCFERYIEFDMKEDSTFTFKTKDERVEEDKRELERNSYPDLDDYFVYYRKKAEDSLLFEDIAPMVNIVATRKNDSEEKINVKYGIRKNNLTATSDGQDTCAGTPTLLHEDYIDLAGVLPFKYRDTDNHPDRVITNIDIEDAKTGESLKSNIEVGNDGSWSAKVDYETHGINEAFIKVIGYNDDRVVMIENHYLVKN